MSTRNEFLTIEHAFFTNYLNKKNSRTHKKVIQMCPALERTFAEREKNYEYLKWRQWSEKIVQSLVVYLRSMFYELECETGRSWVLAKFAVNDGRLDCEIFNFLATFDALEISSTESMARLTWFTVDVRSRYTNERCWTTSKRNYSKLKAPWPNVLNCSDSGSLGCLGVKSSLRSLLQFWANVPDVKRLKVQDCCDDIRYTRKFEKPNIFHPLPRAASCVHLHSGSCEQTKQRPKCADLRVYRKLINVKYKLNSFLFVRLSFNPHLSLCLLSCSLLGDTCKNFSWCSIKLKIFHVRKSIWTAVVLLIQDVKTNVFCLLKRRSMCLALKANVTWGVIALNWILKAVLFDFKEIIFEKSDLEIRKHFKNKKAFEKLWSF